MAPISWDNAYKLFRFLEKFISNRPGGSARCYLYGAGNSGKLLLYILKRYDIEVSGFIDRNADIDRVEFFGVKYPVFPPTAELDQNSTLFVCTSPYHYHQINESYLKRTRYRNVIFLWEMPTHNEYIPTALNQRSNRLLELTERHLINGQIDDASDCYKQARSLHQHIDKEDYLGLIIHAANKNFANAFEVYNKVLAKNDSNAVTKQADYSRSGILHSLTDPKKNSDEEALFKHLKRLTGDTVSALNLEGLYLSRIANIEKAIKTFQSACSLEETNSVATYNAILLTFDFESPEKARQLCLQAMEKQIDHQRIQSLHDSISFSQVNFDRSRPRYITTDLTEKGVASPQVPVRILVSMHGAGTHFLANFIYRILGKNPPQLSQYDVNGMNSEVLMSHLVQEENRDRLLSVHLKYSKYSTLLDSQARIIHLLRHPLDALVTLFRHNANYSEAKSKDSWDIQLKKQIRIKGWLADFLEGDSINWIKSGKVYPLRYEDFIYQPAKYLRDICNFLQIAVDDRQLDRAVMDNFYYINDDLRLGRYPMLFDPASDGKRRGTPGEWKNYLDNKDLEIIRAECKEHFDYLGYTI